MSSIFIYTVILIIHSDHFLCSGVFSVDLTSKTVCLTVIAKCHIDIEIGVTAGCLKRQTLFVRIVFFY